MRRGLLLLSLIAVPLAFAAAEPIGNVGDLNGEAYGTPPQNLRRQLAMADSVVQDEFVEIVGNGGISIVFVDGSTFHLGSNSSAKLDRYLFDPNAANGDGVVQLGQGVFRFISAPGTSHDGLEIETPNSVIGIRGTDVVVQVSYQTGTTVGTIEGLAEARSRSTGQLVSIPPGDVGSIGLDGVATVETAPVGPQDIGCYIGNDEYICLAALGGSGASGASEATDTFSGPPGNDDAGSSEAGGTASGPGPSDPGGPSDPAGDVGDPGNDPGNDPGPGDPAGGGNDGDP